MLSIKDTAHNITWYRHTMNRNHSIKIALYFVWLRIDPGQFPGVPNKGFMVCEDEATSMIPQSNLDILHQWREAFPDEKICVWTARTLLSDTQYAGLQAQVGGISGVELCAIEDIFHDDEFFPCIADIAAEQITSFDKNFDIGFLVDMVKFRAAAHCIKMNPNIVYLHSDFDYKPISREELIKQAGMIGFSCNWKVGYTPENDFFIIDCSHEHKLPGLISSMNEAISKDLREKMYLVVDTDTLYIRCFSSKIEEAQAAAADAQTFRNTVSLQDRGLSPQKAQHEVRSWQKAGKL